MYNLKCIKCGAEWFSAAKTDYPCAYCGGKVCEKESSGKPELRVIQGRPPEKTK